jgi:hypothetical protein
VVANSLTPPDESGWLPDETTTLVVVGSQTSQHPTGDSMTTYSFLDRETNKILGIAPDIVYSLKETGNALSYCLEGNVLVVEEYENCYEDERCVATKSITLKKGDHIIATGISGLTLIYLSRLGVKVSLLDSEVKMLPPERQTEDIKAKVLYFLVSLG